MTDAYAPYPALEAAPQENYSPHMSDDSLSGHPPQTDTAASNSRRHAACDECRKRKLKCSGEPTGCSRCVKNAIPCIYSRQKQMGRPRKKQKTDETHSQEQPLLACPNSSYTYSGHTTVPSLPQSEPHTDTTPIDPSLANVDHEMTSFQNVCSGPIAQTIRAQRETDESFRDPANMFEQGGTDINLGSQFSQYPTDISQWPDFSTIETLPLPLTTKYVADPALDPIFSTSSSSVQGSGTHGERPYYDADADPATLQNLPATPSCPCLPNLYLSLSTLSTLTSFPVSQHTLDTLLSAHKTAHSVIYCPVCPQQYQSGAQNLMLGCTLLNVLADHWHRVRKSTIDDLKRGFGTPEQRNQVNGNGGFISTREGQAWRHFVKRVIRAYVFGDAPIPKPPPPSTSIASTPTPTSTATVNDNHHEATRVPEHLRLTFLISALERRQRQWHRLDEPTDEFPDRWAADYPSHRGHSRDYGKGRPKTIVEVAGKIHDPDDPVSRRRSGSIDTDGRNQNGISNGTAGGDGGGGNVSKGHDDTLLCLIIVKHSKDIVSALDEEQ